MTFLFYDQDHHLNPTLPMKEYQPKSKIPATAGKLRGEPATDDIGRTWEEHTNKSQPKPVVSEWTTTADKDGDCAITEGTKLIGVAATVTQALNITERHNAALAEVMESRDRWNQWCHNAQQQLAAEKENNDAQAEAYVRRIQQLREQLADAEATIKSQDELIDALGANEIATLREQLAAEKEKREQTERALSVQCDATMQLEAQLAAERERVKHLFNLYLWSDEELKELRAKVK